MATTRALNDLSADLRRLFARAKMPTNPALASEILNLSNDENSCAADFAELVRADPALATRLLKSANSAVFAQRTPVTTIARAITVLGLHRVKTTALGFQLVSHLDQLGGVPFDLRRFWQDSLLRACLAHSIAQTVVPQCAQEAFLVGLLQECGVLLLVQTLGSSYASLCRSAHSPWAFYEVERKAFPYTHIEAISVMASEWRLPKIIAIPLERHHEAVQLGEGASEIEKLSAVGYFVGGLSFRGNSTISSEETELRQFGSVALRLDDTAWAHAQKEAIAEYNRVSTLFAGATSDNIDVTELLSEANRRLTSVAEESELQAIDAQAEHARIQREQSRLEQSLREYRERSALDPLTNVLNRGALTEATRQAIEENLDKGLPIGVFFLDIDSFKRLNDTYGHHVGDQVLKAIASLLGTVIENRGTVGRYGGEEFVALLRGLSAQATRETAERVVKRVRELDTRSFALSEPVTCSLGAVWSDRLPVNSAEKLFAAADELMYKAKRAGKDRCCFEMLQQPAETIQADHRSRAGAIPSDETKATHSGDAPETHLDEMLALARQLNDNDVDGFIGIRKQERKRVVAPCTLHHFGGTRHDLLAHPAVTRNLSTGGIAVLVDRPMARGEPVEIVLNREASKLFLAGLVSFCRHIQERTHEVGVQFVSHSVTPIISGDVDLALKTHDWIAEALDTKLTGKIEFAECK